MAVILSLLTAEYAPEAWGCWSVIRVISRGEREQSHGAAAERAEGLRLLNCCAEEGGPPDREWGLGRLLVTLRTYETDQTTKRGKRGRSIRNLWVCVCVASREATETQWLSKAHSWLTINIQCQELKSFTDTGALDDYFIQSCWFSSVCQQPNQMNE